MCVGTYVHMYGGLKLNQVFPLTHPHFSHWGTVSNFGLSSSLAFPGDPISVSEERSLQVAAIAASLLHGFWRSKVGSSHFHVEPSPQPIMCFLFRVVCSPDGRVPRIHKAPGSTHTQYKPGMVVHACKPSLWKAGGSDIQGS